MGMSSEFTPAGSTLTRLYKGDPRLKRVEVSIISKKHPETALNGYALVTELNETMLSFFSTQKFKIDEELILKVQVNSDDLEFRLKMSHLHEQISSGRVMTALPTEENPFPARKFYRCFAKVIELKRNGIYPQADSHALANGESPAPLQVVPDEVTASATEAEPKVA